MLYLLLHIVFVRRTFSKKANNVSIKLTLVNVLLQYQPQEKWVRFDFGFGYTY